MPRVPPSQPTQAPEWAAMTGRSAVTSPPGESSHPSSPIRTGSRLATITIFMIFNLHRVPDVKRETGLPAREVNRETGFACAQPGESQTMSWTNAAARVMTVVACSGLAAAAAGCGGAATATTPQQQAATRFLAKYAQPDGRVVRLDQGGDTVSEGQAYGMLLAELAGDDAAFRRIWGWTHDHLRLRNGLFAFHANAAGKVVSQQAASDADLLIAWALLRYHGPSAASMHSAGRQVA